MTTGTRPAVAPPPAPLPDLTCTMVVAGATWRELWRRRRLLSLGLLLLLPVLLLLALRAWYPGSAPVDAVLAILAGELYIPVLLPIVAMAVGAPAVSEPLAEGTLVYFWTRPLRRHALYLGRVAAAAMVACSLVLLSQALVFLVLVFGFGGADLAILRLHAETTVVTLLAAFAYTALFGCFGAWFRKPMWPAIILAFGWEPMVVNIPARIQEWTLQFHLGNLVHWPATEPDDVGGLIAELLRQQLHREPVPAWQSVAVLLGVIVVSTVLGVRLLRSRQLDRQG